jgi:septal ring factor EnvC (AmiA/AmiB activator)
MSRLRSGRKINKEALQSLVDSEKKVSLSFALKPKLKLEALELLEENSSDSMSELCETLLEEWTDHAREGKNLLEYSAELQRVSDELKAFKKQAAALQKSLDQQQALHQQTQQTVQAQRAEIERLKGQLSQERQEKENMRQAQQQLEASHVLISAPAELKEAFAELCEDYKHTKLNTPALVLARCMYKQVTEPASYIPKNFKLHGPRRELLEQYLKQAK